ncbi:MAG: hypothetical protein WDO71_26930 [Bacteroidota bacterium]
MLYPVLLPGYCSPGSGNHYQDIKLADYAKYNDKNIIPFNQFFPNERFLLAIGYASLIRYYYEQLFLAGFGEYWLRWAGIYAGGDKY